MVRTLEEIVTNEDINKIKKQVSLLKLRFMQLNKEEAEQRRLEKASAGEAAESKEPEAKGNETAETENAEAENGAAEEQLTEEQLLDKRFHAAFAKYKENKQKYIDRLEQQKADNLGKG